MNVAMLGHKRIPSREGGVEIVVEQLSTRMVEQGHKVTCYNRGGHHVSGEQYDTKDAHEYKGVKIKKAWTIDKKGLAAVSSSVFATISASFGKYDVVHIHAEGPAFMCWLPKLFGKKVIVTVHGLDHQRAKWGKFASWYIRTGEKNAVKFADDIIVLSEGVKQYFFDKYNRKTVFIPNGVERPNIIEPEIVKEKWNLEKDGYILYLGRLVPEKGIHYLIDAYKELDTDLKLVIAGGNSDTGEYEKEIRKSESEKIIFTGFQQGKALEELYSNAYIYCLPSDLEGMPLSLLEAMSYKNCCVVSNIDECTEVIEDNAFIFEKGNIKDLTNKLQKLCDNAYLVRNLKDKAQDFICNKYNWDNVVENTLRLYE